MAAGIDWFGEPFGDWFAWCAAVGDCCAAFVSSGEHVALIEPPVSASESP
ncbi:unnamed protein product [marine sediment metagenome]|uniref:Uncharacterized protein n=1 Tax=marine sediment metagenome TaxID=412755 RepID=X0UEK3_9ZZZZ